MNQNLRDVLETKLKKEELNKLPRAFDVIGSIAILQLPPELKGKRKIIAEALLNLNKNIKTVLVKSSRVKGRLRTMKLQFIAGKKTKEALYRENGCLMKLNVEKCYFSPRLSNERLEIANSIKGKKKVLVMFAGVAPYAIIMAKKNQSAEIVAVELNRLACKYAEENVRLNKLKNLRITQGDVKRVVPKLKEKFDAIVMPRPQLKESFLKEAFFAAKKGSIIFFYDFVDAEEIPEKAISRIEKEAREAKKKIKILRWKKAGDIAPYRFRVRVDFKVLN